MDKEPQELIEARNFLKQFEIAIEKRKGIFYLEDGLTLLDEVINGPFPEIYKERAIKIRKTYTDMVISKVKEFLATMESYDTGEFLYWWETINSLIHPNSEEVFRSLRIQLIEKWLEGKSMQELEKLLAEEEKEEQRHH